MSAPTIERQFGVEDGEKQSAKAAAQDVLGKAAISSETSRRPELETPDGVEMFLSHALDVADLDIESTKVFAASDGTQVRAAKITSTEELVHVELPKPDEELGVKSLVIDAEYVDPYLSSGDTLVRVSTIHHGDDGMLVLDRITDPEQKGYATALIADALSEAVGGASKVVKESAGNWALHEQSLKLTSAMRSRHSEVEL